MKWFINCIRNYVNFSGRARRREYWNFVLFSFLLMIVAMILDWICFGQSSFFYGLSGLFLFLPNLAVMARRLHDTGRSAKILIWYHRTDRIGGFGHSVRHGGDVDGFPGAAHRRIGGLSGLGDLLPGVVLHGGDSRRESVRT